MLIQGQMGLIEKATKTKQKIIEICIQKLDRDLVERKTLKIIFSPTKSIPEA